jgi:chromosomal replication initiation ATPase DnaA
MVTRPEAWPNRKLALIGPAGSGKTHLARLFAAQTGAQGVSAADITPDMPLPTGPLVVEDADQLSPIGEEWVFHAHNVLAREGHAFLVTAQTPAARWPLTLPDLASRLAAATSVKIENPDDALLTAVLLKHFADRQLSPAPDAVSYLIKHIPRSFEAVRDIVATLDKQALAQSKPITRPFVCALLDSAPPPAR